jgi:hypothetical protein
MTVTDKLALNLEVKAPAALWQPTESLLIGRALMIVRASLRSAGLGAKGQLPIGHPAILAIAGMLLSDESFDLMTTAAEATLSSLGRGWPHLLGIASFNLRQRIEVSGDRVHVLLEHVSTLRRNPHYSERAHDSGRLGRTVAPCTALGQCCAKAYPAQSEVLHVSCLPRTRGELLIATSASERRIRAMNRIPSLRTLDDC